MPDILNNRGTMRFSGPLQPGAFPWQQVHGYGTLANRPPACPALLGYRYVASDGDPVFTESQCVLVNGQATWANLAAIGMSDGQIWENIGGVLTGIPIPALAFGGQLYTTTNTPYPTSDTTAVTILYYGPAIHDRLPLYDGTRWRPVVFTETSLALTNTSFLTASLSGTTITYSSGANASLVRGMQVTGTGVPANTTITAIPTATTITVNNTLTTTGSTSLTFKVPPSTAYDVFAVLVNGALQLRLVAWTSSTARATSLALLNGVPTNSAAINASDVNGIAINQGVYLGSVYTTATAGQTSDAGNVGTVSASNTVGGGGAKRYVFNAYNQAPKSLYFMDSGLHNYAIATTRQWNANASAKIELFLGQPQSFMAAFGGSLEVGTAGQTAYILLGVDSTTSFLPVTAVESSNAQYVECGVSIPVNIAVGYHAINLLELSNVGAGGGNFFNGYLATAVPI